LHEAFVVFIRLLHGVCFIYTKPVSSKHRNPGRFGFFSTDIEFLFKRQQSQAISFSEKVLAAKWLEQPVRQHPGD
jgi:hypothetical protein